jgi:hypothetical protein
MKIIFSRKGFDSSFGKVPSPIFPDGKMLSLPIPDRNSKIQYQDIRWNEYNLGEIVSSLTNGRIKPRHFAHLDPDINMHSVQRSNGWMPVFGQASAAQGHLRNNNICEGDVFLFFGLFQEVIFSNGIVRWKPNSPRKHVLWGWLQIGQVLKLDSGTHEVPDWLNYHPHVSGQQNYTNNTIYISNNSGVFESFSESLQLTMSKSPSSPESPSLTTWKLPLWMYPENGKTPLTYHPDMGRWKILENYVQLNAVAKGQEFILNCDEYPEAIDWLNNLIQVPVKFP